LSEETAQSSQIDLMENMNDFGELGFVQEVWEMEDSVDRGVLSGGS